MTKKILTLYILNVCILTSTPAVRCVFAMLTTYLGTDFVTLREDVCARCPIIWHPILIDFETSLK